MSLWTEPTAKRGNEDIILPIPRPEGLAKPKILFGASNEVSRGELERLNAIRRMTRESVKSSGGTHGCAVA